VEVVVDAGADDVVGHVVGQDHWCKGACSDERVAEFAKVEIEILDLRCSVAAHRGNGPIGREA